MAPPSNDKRALLAQLLRDKTQKAKQAPMSFAQERMWFLYQWNPTSAAFNMPGAVRMSGEVDTEALRKALQELARRHETLRTTFSEQDGRLIQTVAPTLELPLALVDLRDVPEAQREQRVREHITAEATRPFDLTRGPLLRAGLLRLAEREHVLVLCLHHIIGDGWSQGVFIHEMATLYAAFVRGEPSPLKPLPLQYAEFSSWQREWLQGDRFETQLSWWREQLDANAVLELPTDRPRPAALSPSGARQKVVLPPALSQALKALSQHEGKTLFVTLLSAFNVLLHRYSGQEDIVVGTPIAGRTRSELEGMIGLFINTLALRTPLSGALRFRELMGQVHQTTVEAFAHQEVPFERLVDALKPERRLSHSPLFQVMFILQNAPMPPLQAPGLVMEYQQPETGTAKIDLTLIAAELPEGLRLVVEYSTDLFDAATMSRLLEHYQTLLAGIVANPESPIAHLPLLPEPERRTVLAEGNGPAVQYPREACVHELIQAQVERTPEAVALVNGTHSLTYAELNTRANQLAHALRERGVGPDSPVGVCTTRSLDMVVALLGIHKAGGAYVPLDPAYPRERLEYMLRDSGARVLVTQSHVDAPLQPGDSVTRLDVDTLAPAPEGASNPSARAASDNVAYVIYTSGSTGRPKGVQVPHRTVANFFTAMDAALERPERGVWLAVTSISFDISVLELLWTLSRGFTVVVQSDTLGTNWLPEAVRQHAVTHLQCTPSMARALLLDAPSSEALRSLKQMLVGGEAMSTELARELRQRVPSLLNMYGPTETTVWSSTHPVPAGHEGPVPLGTPIVNTQLHVLDEQMQPVLLGVAGELYIGGDGVVRGYLGRPELTAERFVPDPFSTTPGARLYRTGDRVRRRSDGALDFLGRIDFQVKVRGFRIELGEIESALDKHPGVRQSVVLARESKSGDPRLVAYLTSSGQQAPTPAELRTFLKQHLPEYMVPSAFMVLEQLPLTPNGKVNRKALPAPEAPTDSAAYIAPRTPTEEKLAALWAEVLSVPRVGAEDNFFELGGHSLLAMRALSRLRATLQVELSVRALFEAPTLSAFALKVDESLKQAREGSRPPPVRPMPRTGDIPLAFAQQRLWFLDQLEPGNPVYNTPVALRLSGPVDPEALRRAFEELVRRHESLRTTYSSRDGQPLQVISPSLSLPLELLDVRDTPASAREARAKELIRQEILRPFELARGPLLRATLLRLDSNDHVLLLVIHHIISDGWSMGVLVRDMAALYSAIAAGQQPSLPPLPIQYADFALWQHKWLQGEVLDSQLRYWKQQLSGAPAHLELPTDKPRPAVQSFRGDTLPVAIPRELSESIKTLSKRLGVTPFMTLLAGLQVVLHRYTGQDDISVGTSIAGRRGTELEGLVGFLINTLVLRSRLSSKASFRELLLQVRDTTLAAHEHQDVPFEKLVEHLQPQRDLSRTPLFQVMFILHNAPTETMTLPGGLTLRPLELTNSVSKFDWMLSLGDTSGGFTGGLEYSTDLFERDTMARAMEHLRVVLEAAVAQPETPLSELPLLTRAEKHQLLTGFNGPRADYPRDVCLHQLIQAQVERTPDALALTFEGQSLTYRELDSRANQLAWHLRSLGVGPESRVGLCLERSPEMVVALLATLKAGGAYVPLDPAYPQERLGWMLEDASPTVLLVQERLLSRLPAQGAHVVCLDSGWDEIASRPSHTPPLQSTANGLAYIIFTSGSTGRPKGAMNEHHPVVNRLLWMQEEYKLEARDVVLQKTPFSFDVSVWEFFWPLMQGARLVLAKPGGHQDPNYLANLIAQERVTTLHFVPSMLKVFLEEPNLEQRCVSLRRVVCSGEALPVEFQDQCLQRLPHAELHNLYGPTEAAVDVTYYACKPGQSLRSVPIGRPVANTQIHILDARLQPVPVGVHGELYIGGVQVGRGYRARPHLTAERFIPDPFSSTPGARMYRTGDVARWLPDGNIEYMGRADFQVKIRGLRIELGEIEAHLAQHPAVRQVVVVAREDRPGDKRLVAYVVAPPEQASAAELRSFLQPRLPEHMVPSAFVCLEQLPLSPNGKLERRALPAPEATTSAAGYIAPRTPTEEKLAAIWAKVLSVPRVGAEDHFFELGGHSLLATQVISRLRSTFQVELPVRAFFEATTLSALARKVDEALARQARNGPQTPALRPVPRTGDLPLSFSQQRLWFLDQLEPGSSVYNMPVALRFSGKADPEALRRALDELVRRHESLRTLFTSRNGEPAQLILPSLTLPLEVVDLQDVPAAEREARAQELARQEAQRPFDLARGPLLRAALLRLGAEDHVLLVTLHHIVSDGWSMGVLVREVASLYAAFAAGQQPSLPPLPIQYADFAVWQREWLQGEVLDSQLGYWKQQLSGAAHLELATDKPRPPVQTFRGDSLPVVLPKELSESLKALSTRLGVTPFMTLLAGLQVLLHRYSGQDDISVGSPIAGRRGTELESLIGFFVNTLVLRSRFSPDTSFRGLLEQVRDTTLAAYEHQDVPFEKLVEQLQPQRDLSRSPFFQVAFVLQNAPVEALRLPDLTLRPLQQSSTTAKFEWTLSLTDMPGGFTGSLEYNTDLFEPGTVARAMEHLRILLEGAVANPEARLSELPLLSEAERRKVLVEWNDTRVDYPRDSSIHALFEAQAARTPDAIAVEFEGQSLTYRQLDARSNQLAHALLRLGMRPGLCVALCAERSLEMVVSTLAILKAGGAYVPLDPAYPRERLDFMLRDVGAPLLLAQRHLAERLPSGEARVVLLDSDFSQEAETSPDVHVPPEALAYVMYTSGSTGRPKGVCIPHRGVVRLVIGARYADLGPSEVMLQLAPISFDASTFELWGCLLHGGKLVVLPPHPPSLEELGQAFKQHRITTQFITTALFDQVVSTQLEALSHVRLVLAGGDTLPPERVKARLAHGGLFANVYGPTESTTFATCNILTRPEQVGHNVSIGRPISNTQVYVLDAHLRPAPTGVPGELYIGGDGLAWGYLHRPELTAERFVPNPFALVPGERLYRTGDKVRWLADGTLEFLGRLDSQVKLRGFRIELGEVESALDKCPGVRQSAVLAREDRPGDKRLVAYVVPSAPQAPTSAELRSFLKEHLPEYMVPAAYLLLDHLPRMPSGKVNRRALPV
ncbi:amino acid adenylation domain-containing protein, partial [Archangium sp.]|uniref:non-ribosomal peptide synthetase n=1 Tax=Archangium sp. TaxID=1872627 RepID=UPI00389A4969